MRKRWEKALCLAALCAGLLALCAGARAQEQYTFVARRGTGPYSFRCRIVGQWAQGSEARLVFDFRDAANFRYLSLKPGEAAFIEVAAGASRTFAGPAAVDLNNDLAVTVQRRVGRVRAIVGGQVILSAQLGAPLEGRVGYFCRGAQLEIKEPRVQPVAEVYFTDDFGRAADDPGQWTIVAGKWTNTMVDAPRALPDFSANPFSVCAQGADKALCLAGSWYWDSYRFRASVNPTSAQVVGIAGYAQDEQNYILFRWRRGSSKMRRAKQLVLVRNGFEEVLAEADGGFQPNQWYRLELRFAEGSVHALIDRYPVLSAKTNAFGQGRVGLWLRGERAFFDDVAVVGATVKHELAAKIAEGFQHDSGTVGEVYGPTIPWRLSRDGAIWWHRGIFFHDVAASIPLNPKAGDPKAVIVLGSEERPEAGLVVRCRWQGPRLRLAVEEDGAPQAQSEEFEPASGQDLTVSFDGKSLLRVVTQGREVLRYQAKRRPAGRLLGIISDNPAQVWGSAVESDHQLEYLFSEAPTDFYSTKGQWHITTRWPCEPRWTFFGGENDENPTVWTKHIYRGDFALEFFMNIGMDLPRSPGYSHPSDVNVTVCGDGRSLGSGYSFIIAGWNNTKTALLRRSEVVAQTREFLFENPISANPKFHRHWFRVRVEKAGPTVSLTVDDKPLLRYTDPDPLPDGRIALWTYHNKLMIARGYIWFAEEQPAALPDPPSWPKRQELARGRRQPNVLFNDFENDAGEWHTTVGVSYRLPTLLELDNSTAAGGKRSLKITNMTEGGPFTVLAIDAPIRLRDYPVISFDYRVPPEVKVNLYLLLGGVWHAVEFTARQPQGTPVKVIGAFADVRADGRWHHTSFDLLTALRRLYPGREYFEAQYLAFASPQEDYVRCGIGGNPLGASYWIDNFRLGQVHFACQPLPDVPSLFAARRVS